MNLLNKLRLSNLFKVSKSFLKDQNQETSAVDLMHTRNIIDAKKVIIDVQFGLSNRMRTLASAFVLAKRLNRQLILIWQPDVHCDSEFSDLFIDHHLNVKNINTFDLSNMDSYDYMNGPLRREGKLKINHLTDKDIYIRSAYTLDCELCDKGEEDAFLQSLKPLEEVLQTVNKYELSGKIGLHIRMGAGVNYDLDRWDSDEFLDATGK